MSTEEELKRAYNTLALPVIGVKHPEDKAALQLALNRVLGAITELIGLRTAFSALRERAEASETIVHTVDGLLDGAEIPKGERTDYRVSILIASWRGYSESAETFAKEARRERERAEKVERSASDFLSQKVKLGQKAIVLECERDELRQQLAAEQETVRQVREAMEAWVEYRDAKDGYSDKYIRSMDLMRAALSLTPAAAAERRQKEVEVLKLAEELRRGITLEGGEHHHWRYRFSVEFNELVENFCKAVDNLAKLEQQE